jgi:hypothetical protein
MVPLVMGQIYGTSSGIDRPLGVGPAPGQVPGSRTVSRPAVSRILVAAVLVMADSVPLVIIVVIVVAVVQVIVIIGVVVVVVLVVATAGQS